MATGPLLRRLWLPAIRLAISVTTGVGPSPAASVGGTVSPITLALWPLPTTTFGWGSHRPHSGLNPGLAPHPPEEPGLGLAEDYEFRVVLGYTQEIEDGFFCLDQRFPARFHPIHLLPSLSVTF
jgi:hypothetical protein